MSYQALARKYRPQRFADVVGQETIVRTLQNAIESGRIHHAYLFSGVRGVGKTTGARILAKALNCERGPAAEPCNECTICREITEGIDLDVREIDAATYTGVDNIRELREVTQFAPARDRYRIFIIDEAHMLSTGAWNALLKILEEPPPHVIFMFATTEVNKVPSTILSRVQKFALRKITHQDLIDRITQIAKAESIDASADAIDLIARRGEGSVRDSLSLLDQIIAFSGRSITASDVATVLGLSDTAFFDRILGSIATGDHARLLETLQEAGDTGRDFKLLFRDFLGFIRNLLLLAGGGNEALIAASPEDLAAIREASSRLSYSELLRIANLLIRDDDIIQRAEHQRLAVEITLLKAATFPRLKSVEEALAGERPGSAATPGGSSVRPERSSPDRDRSGVATPRVPRETAAGPAPAPEDRVGGNAADVEPLLARLRKSNPLVANYLARATEVRRENGRIIWTFSDPAFADYVRDAQKTIEEAARELFGGTISVEFRTPETAATPDPSAGRKASPLRDDPVIRAFQKHLGADVVDPAKS